MYLLECGCRLLRAHICSHSRGPLPPAQPNTHFSVSPPESQKALLSLYHGGRRPFSDDEIKCHIHKGCAQESPQPGARSSRLPTFHFHLATLSEIGRWSRLATGDNPSPLWPRTPCRLKTADPAEQSYSYLAEKQRAQFQQEATKHKQAKQTFPSGDPPAGRGRSPAAEEAHGGPGTGSVLAPELWPNGDSHHTSNSCALCPRWPGGPSLEGWWLRVP